LATSSLLLVKPVLTRFRAAG